MVWFYARTNFCPWHGCPRIIVAHFESGPKIITLPLLPRLSPNPWYTSYKLWTTLRIILFWFQFEIVQFLHQERAVDITRQNEFGMTALHYAAHSGHIEVFPKWIIVCYKLCHFIEDTIVFVYYKHSSLTARIWKWVRTKFCTQSHHNLV